MRSVSVKYTTAAAMASALTYSTPALILTFSSTDTHNATRSNAAICWIPRRLVISVTANRREWKGSVLGFDSALHDPTYFLILKTFLFFHVQYIIHTFEFFNLLPPVSLPQDIFSGRAKAQVLPLQTDSKFTVYIIYVVFLNIMPHKCRAG